MMETLTVGPDFLYSRKMLYEMSPGGLEHKVALEGRETLELAV